MKKQLSDIPVVVSAFGEDTPNFDYPASCPKTSKLIVSFSGGASLFYEDHSYRISTNRLRSHWLLWEDCRGDENGNNQFVPVAWCQRPGVKQEVAILLMLRELWKAHKGIGYDCPNCMDIDCINGIYIISEEDFFSVLRDVWPDQEYD